jgi:hypothetical protein
MSYSNSFPQQRPTLNLDFANSGKLDSRISFSRADSTPSAVHYWSNEKHLSTENLTSNSEDFSAWPKINATASANTTAAPDGNMTASTMTGNAGTSVKYLSSNSASVTDPVISFYAKSGTHSYIQISDNASASEYANFDLTNGTVGNVGPLATAAIEAVGSTGWYRCIMRVERTSAAFTWRVVMIDSSTAARQSTTSSTGTVNLWGAMMTELGDLTNVVAYQSSGTQIHRSYAPTLKSVANAGDPRFEYDPASDGQSVGLLIEAQETNLQRYGSAFASWSTKLGSGLTANAGIAPNGELAATLWTATSSSNYHYLNDSFASVTSGTTYTASVYVKDAGQRYVQILGGASAFGAGQYATFDLQTGSVDATGVTASSVSVGNGWWRIQATMTATGTGTSIGSLALVESATASRLPTFTADDYSGVLLFGYQFEANSEASSLVNTGSQNSALTRASDSCSVATSSFYTGGPVSVYTDADAGAGNTPSIFSLSKNNTASDSIRLFRDLPSSNLTTNFRFFVKDGGVSVAQRTVSGSGSVSKFAVRSDTNNTAIKPSGITQFSDTVCTTPVIDTLEIGGGPGVGQLNGTIRNLMLWNVALSDTELATLVD